MDIEQYISDHTSPEPEHLYRLWRRSNLATVHGRMASGHVQGRLLKMLVQMLRPERVLEIGTFTGYSAVAMAEGLPPGGHLWTYEINDEMEDLARQGISESPYADRITLLIGDAVAEAPRLGLTFQMVFIDGDKRHYVEAYRAVRTMVTSGGFIVADNTLWDGHVIDPAYDREPQTAGLRLFNDMVAADTTVEQVMLPLRDGLTLIRCN
jgi:predicted O-methyltransferase YrrM